MAKKEVKIPVNQMVKEYTIATLKRLGVAAETGKVYNQLKERGTVEPKTNSETRRLAKMLAKEIPTFLPNHVPIDKKKKGEYVIFNAEWKAKIEGLITDDTFTPIYLRDEVDKVLREKGYNGCCTRNHLIWWLSLKGADHMTPEEIAEGIMGHDYEDWSQFRLVEKDAYHPRLEIPDELFYQHIEKQSTVGYNSDTADAQRKNSLRFSPLTSEQQRERQTYIDDFLDKVEFIYEMDGKAVDQKTVDKLKNDLDVLKEFRKWRDAPLTTAQYEEKYEELRDQLKTAPPRKKKRGAAKKKATDVASPVFPTLPTNTIEISEVQSGDEQTEEVIESSANESTEKPSVAEQVTGGSTIVDEQSEDNKTIEYDMGITVLDRAQTKIENDLPLDPDEQLALVKIHECPICGEKLVEKTGLHREYISHKDSKPCPYIAWGTFEKPEIHERYNKSVERKK